jgi:hypothetical protein
MAGLIATRNVHAVFFVGGVLMLVALFVSYKAAAKADLHAKIPTS